MRITGAEPERAAAILRAPESHTRAICTACSSSACHVFQSALTQMCTSAGARIVSLDRALPLRAARRSDRCGGEGARGLQSSADRSTRQTSLMRCVDRNASDKLFVALRVYRACRSSMRVLQSRTSLRINGAAQRELHAFAFSQPLQRTAARSIPRHRSACAVTCSVEPQNDRC